MSDQTNYYTIRLIGLSAIGIASALATGIAAAYGFADAIYILVWACVIIFLVAVATK